MGATLLQADERTDRHDEVNVCFSQSCERAQKLVVHKGHSTATQLRRVALNMSFSIALVQTSITSSKQETCFSPTSKTVASRSFPSQNFEYADNISQNP